MAIDWRMRRDLPDLWLDLFIDAGRLSPVRAVSNWTGAARAAPGPAAMLLAGVAFGTTTTTPSTSALAIINVAAVLWTLMFMANVLLVG